MKDIFEVSGWVFLILAGGAIGVAFIIFWYELFRMMLNSNKRKVRLFYSMVLAAVSFCIAFLIKLLHHFMS
jgi:DMSO reductase anchor subunit